MLRKISILFLLIIILFIGIYYGLVINKIHLLPKPTELIPTDTIQAQSAIDNQFQVIDSILNFINFILAVLVLLLPLTFGIAIYIYQSGKKSQEDLEKQFQSLRQEFSSLKGIIDVSVLSLTEGKIEVGKLREGFITFTVENKVNLARYEDNLSSFKDKVDKTLIDNLADINNIITNYDALLKGFEAQLNIYQTLLDVRIKGLQLLNEDFKKAQVALSFITSMQLNNEVLIRFESIQTLNQLLLSPHVKELLKFAIAHVELVVETEKVGAIKAQAKQTLDILQKYNSSILNA